MVCKEFLDSSLASAELDGFKLVRLLGHGVDGFAYLMLPRSALEDGTQSLDQLRKAMVCIKIAANGTAADALRQEIRIYKDLRRTGADHVPKLLAHSSGIHPYLAIQAVHGLTMWNCLEAVTEIPTPFVWRAVVDLLQGVKHNWGFLNGLFHGDLHSNNIMLTCVGSESRSSLPKTLMIDFGRSFRRDNPETPIQALDDDCYNIAGVVRDLINQCSDDGKRAMEADPDLSHIRTFLACNYNMPLDKKTLKKIIALAVRRLDAELASNPPSPQAIADMKGVLERHNPLISDEQLRRVQAECRV